MELDDQKRVDILTRIPMELVENVIKFLDLHGMSHWGFLGQCCLVCKTWNLRFSGSRIWIKLGQRYGVRIKRISSSSSQQCELATPKAQFFQQFSRLKGMKKRIVESEIDLLELAAGDAKMDDSRRWERREQLIQEHRLEFDIMQYSKGYIGLGE